MDVRRSWQGQDAPSANPRRGCGPGARSAEGALRGVLSFGYFSLHKQRKVTRRQAKALLLRLLPGWRPLNRRSGFSRDRQNGLSLSRLKPLLQIFSSDEKASINSSSDSKSFKGFRPCGRVTFLCSRKEKVTKRKRALPSRPPRCALRVRVHHGDPRKGHPAPAADGVHPCTPPFGFFPAMAAASEGNPVNQKQKRQPKPEPSNGNGNGNGRSIPHNYVRFAQLLAQQPQHP
ncbi:hypothetical protein [Xanthomonas sacchari]|uniref:hypothetical protein n=1 Tax=Xanthomonas sacchari TaxID=56458 RepID=UPI00225590FD|nr:hypothetical protein [Xanthomonas sacchari]